MRPIDERVKEAEALWVQGREAETMGDFKRAYELCTAAHDLVTDCPAYHRTAHIRLRRINLKIGNYGELISDWALHFLAPLGVFEMVAHFQKSGARLAGACRRA